MNAITTPLATSDASLGPVSSIPKVRIHPTRSGAVAVSSVVLATLVFAVYWPALRFGFLYYDDPLYISANSIVKSGITWEGIRYAFTSMMGFWQPLTWLALMLQVEIFGIDPHAFHLCNVLLHSANVLLLFRIAFRISAKPWPSVVISALFACHPLTVESVVWISELKGLLASFLGLLSTLIYLNYATSRSFRTYSMVALTYLFGLMAKPSILSLPFVFMLIDYMQFKGLIFPRKSTQPILSTVQGVWRIWLAEKLPLLLIGITFLFATYIAEERFGALRNLSEISFGARVQNVINSVWVYVSKVFYPASLSIFYPSQKAIPLDSSLLAATFLAGLIALAIHLRRKFLPLALGLGGFAITLSPHLGFIRVGEHAMADRYMYIPLIFIVATAVLILQHLSRSQKMSTFANALPVALVLALAINSRAYVLLWSSDQSLFQHALDVAPNRNFVAHNILGLCDMDSGKLDAATSHFAKASQIAANSPIPHHNLALVHQRAGRVIEAEAEYRQALALSPNASGTLANFADFLFANAIDKDARIAESLRHSERALILCPDDPQKYDLLASILFRMGNTNGAHRILDLAARLNGQVHASKQ